MEKTRKHSKKRDAILSCIRSTSRHPSAEWIYDQLKPQIPDLSRGTVYRNLRLFLEDGVVSSVGVVGGLERFDGDTAPHAHLICRCCGAVVDVPGLDAPAELAGQAEAITGGQVDACALSFSGLCWECSTNKKRRAVF